MRAIRTCRCCLSAPRVTDFKAGLLFLSNELYSTFTFFSRVRSAAISAVSCIDVPPSPTPAAAVYDEKATKTWPFPGRPQFPKAVPKAVPEAVPGAEAAA